jgi:hypothetical protein
MWKTPTQFCPFLGAFAKLQKATISFIMSVRPSVRPNETIRLPLEWFSRNLILQYFSKICRENSSLIKIWQEERVLYVKTNKHFWSYLAQYFLEWKIVSDKFVQKLETHILCSFFFFRNSCRLWDKVENTVQRGWPQMTTWCMRIACWIPKVKNTHTHNT